MALVWRGYVRLLAGEGRKFRVAAGGKAVLVDGEEVRSLPEEGEAEVEGRPEGWDLPVSVYPGPDYLQWKAEGEDWQVIPRERMRPVGGNR